jgi:4'-phosphopantetheinyl transferase
MGPADLPLACLAPGTADVWCVDPSSRASEAALDRYADWLAIDERERAGRFAFERDRRTSLVAWALVRASLSHYAAVDPRDWVFDRNERGHPRILRPHGFAWLRFSLSHTDGLAACAIARDTAVGVDVECVDRDARCLDLARRVLAPAEHASVSMQPRTARVARFLSHWTLKEAYVKARGLGLALPLDAASFALCAGHRAHGTFDARLADDAKAWSFRLFRPTQRHLLAIALREAQMRAVRVHLKATLQAMAPALRATF